jgi:flagellar operon protein (TIGR03826 family)
MQAINCPRCGRVFTKITKPICNACVKEDEDTFELVRAYIKENPDQTLQQVSDETHVHVKRILQYIRDGRLEASTGMSDDVGCGQCGKPISKGRFCEVCAGEIKKNVLIRPKHETEVKKAAGRMRVNTNK